MTSTFREYQRSKQLSRYKFIAQKLSQHLQNLAEDKNTRKRWLWELIQNAKDVPNQFGKVKIKLQINEKNFKFKHNGDPFRTSDLESVVCQYSSKPQQNKIDCQTTGKYGTGFITTYILSRKLIINGILKSQKIIKEQSDDSWEDQPQERQSNIKKEQISLSLNPESSEISQLDIEKQISLNESMLSNVELISKKQEEISQLQRIQLNYLNKGLRQMGEKQNILKLNQSQFQRFEIRLDRRYKDRDNEFIKKLMKMQEKIMESLKKNQLFQPWVRKQDDYDTCFSYESLDQAAFDIIEEGISTLKDLFPYALLFNPKLYQISVIDNRKHKKINNFIIKKQKNEELGHIKISVCKYIEGQVQKMIRMGYRHHLDTAMTIAVPIQRIGQTIKLLTLPHGIPKIFKQFPLIGAQDTGYNYIFTSKKFYPNETRSNLMLQSIEGRISNKRQSNWSVLNNVFLQAKKLFKNLSVQVSRVGEFPIIKKMQFFGKQGLKT